MNNEVNLSLLNLANSKTKKASKLFERLVEHIVRFEENLAPELQVGGRLVSSGDITFSIEDIGFWNPDVIIFYGTLPDGSKIELVQHVSQLSVLLVAVPRKEKVTIPKRKIGFQMDENVVNN